MEAALQWLYPLSVLEDPLLCIQRSFLATLNYSVDEINSCVLQRLPGSTGNIYTPSQFLQIANIYLSATEVYYSQDSIKEGGERPLNLHGDVLQNYLSILNEPGVPSHKLELKVGAICTIQRNLSTEKGLVKNARVIIQDLNRHSIRVAVLLQPHAVAQDMQEFPLVRITFEFNPDQSSWTVVQKQFPLRLAYATTFNSSQGLTLNRAVIDLRHSVFAHGQLYTALTRFGHRDRGRVLFAPTNVLGQTSNIVSQELLL